MADARQVRVFKALANDARYDILRTLAADRAPHTCQELIATLGISPPAVSNHLRILEDADLIAIERQGGQLQVQLAASDVAFQMAAFVRTG